MASFSRREEDFGHMSWTSKVMSEEKYHELEQLSPDRKYEYIGGRAYLMSGGTIGHDVIRRNIELALHSRLRSRSCRVFGDNVQVRVGTRKNEKAHFVYPDTTVSCKAADWQLNNTLVEEPRVIVEVLSSGTEAKDRGVKFDAYQRCPSIQEIVLVNQFSPLVEVWRRNEDRPEDPAAWHYARYRAGQVVNLASLDLRLSMDEIYQDIDFPVEEEDNEE